MYYRLRAFVLTAGGVAHYTVPLAKKRVALLASSLVSLFLPNFALPTLRVREFQAFSEAQV